MYNIPPARYIIDLIYFQIDVLQETVRYIEDLERRLLAQVQSAGLPRQLVKFEHKDDGHDRTEPLPRRSPVQIEDLRNLLHSSLQPVLEEKLKKQRLEDENNIAQLLSDAGSTNMDS